MLVLPWQMTALSWLEWVRAGGQATGPGPAGSESQAIHEAAAGTGIRNHFQYSRLICSEPILAGRRRIRRIRGGNRSCGPRPPVHDYRGRGAPSHGLGGIDPYVRSCGGPESVRDGGEAENSFDQLVIEGVGYVTIS